MPRVQLLQWKKRSRQWDLLKPPETGREWEVLLWNSTKTFDEEQFLLPINSIPKSSPAQHQQRQSKWTRCFCCCGKKTDRWSRFKWRRWGGCGCQGIGRDREEEHGDNVADISAINYDPSSALSTLLPRRRLGHCYHRSGCAGANPVPWSAPVLWNFAAAHVQEISHTVVPHKWVIILFDKGSCTEDSFWFSNSSCERVGTVWILVQKIMLMEGNIIELENGKFCFQIKLKPLLFC